MPERQEAELRLKSTLIPIHGVDFTQPWHKILAPINDQLTEMRYPLITRDIPHHFLVSNLNAPKIECDTYEYDRGLDGFDPVRTAYNLLEEEYSPKSRAVAKLGLQEAYWRGLYIELFNAYPNRLSASDWQAFTCVPVFVRDGQPYLLLSDIQPAVSGIQYGGDADMISYAQEQKMTVDGIVVPFAKLGIARFCGEYIAARKQIDRAESKAQRDAIKQLKQKPQVWNRLRSIYPNIDKVFAAKVKSPKKTKTRDNPRDYHFMFLPQAFELTNQLFGFKENEYVLDEWSIFAQQMAVELATFLYKETRYDYSRSLRFNQKFIDALYQLGHILSNMYTGALDFWEK